MQLGNYALVLVSAGTHAYWNFLLKKAKGGQIFVGLSKILEVVIFAPVFAWWALPGISTHLSAWPLVLGGAFLTLSNYVALARAYEAGDLSVAYPISRGGTLLFLPLLGFLVFGERLSVLGWVAIACIIVGIVVLNLRGLDRSAAASLSAMGRDPSVGFALAAALAAAGYTVWDKRAVQTLPPFTYFYAYTAVVAIAYAAFLHWRFPRGAVGAEWRAHWWPLVQVAVFNTITYLLVLTALRSGTSSYVIALRQLSIAVGALLGWQLLGESFGPPKRAGVALLVAGCILLALAR
jgi:drug/metabolite transporter (DMT)-like permease